MKKSVKVLATGGKALNEMFNQIVYPKKLFPERKVECKATRKVNFVNGGFVVEFKTPHK